MPISNRPRRIQIYKDKALSSDKGTETFVLPTNGMIVSLDMQVRAKNGATNNSFDAVTEKTVEQSITNITVNSGSAIFKSYTGEMCRKIATYRNGVIPQTLITGIAGGTWAGNEDPELGWQQALFPIDFCTKDDPYGNKTQTIFPAPLYSSLDLKIDYDFAISATAGFVTGGSNHLMDLYATVLPRQDPLTMQNKRILSETKKIDYTTVATGDQPFILTREPGNVSFLRQLYVDCYAQGIGEGTQITKLTLEEDGNNEISSSWGALQARNAADCNLHYEKTYYCDPTDGTTVHYTRVPAAFGMISGYEAPTIVPWLDLDNDTITVTNDSGEMYVLKVASNVLPACAVLDFDVDGLMMNLQPTNVNSLDLVVTNGAASGVTQVIEQHVSKAWGYQ
jgi:hypothetical protein